MGKKKDGKRAIRVCTDSACARKGGKELKKRLETLVEEMGASNRTKVSKCGCVDKCDKAPVVVLPGKVVRKRVSNDDLGKLVKKALS